MIKEDRGARLRIKTDEDVARDIAELDEEVAFWREYGHLQLLPAGEAETRQKFKEARDEWKNRKLLTDN